MATELISLPLLVREWLENLCPKKLCFFIQAYHDIKWDPTRNIEEHVLGSIVVTPKSPTYKDNYIMDVTLNHCIIEAWSRNRRLHDADGVHAYSPYTLNLDWHSPLFFKKMSKVIKCRCPKKKK